MRCAVSGIFWRVDVEGSEAGKKRGAFGRLWWLPTSKMSVPLWEMEME